MPPKSSSGKEKDIAEEDEILQAVILADSFNKRFKPLTVGKPRVRFFLLPVWYPANYPLTSSVYCRYATRPYWTGRLRVSPLQEYRRSSSFVDHTRTRSRLPSGTFLLSSVFLSPHSLHPAFLFPLTAIAISHHTSPTRRRNTRDSKWSKPSTGLKIVPIVTAKETFSPGDAMRDIYTHQIITSDFVLVTGDLVSNMRIDEVVRVHKERRRTNKDAIMTMVVKESGATHRTR